MGPLISPEEEDGLSTHMQNLLGWYKVHIKKIRTSNRFHGGRLKGASLQKIPDTY
jgi:hypothetical protein